MPTDGESVRSSTRAGSFFFHQPTTTLMSLPYTILLFFVFTRAIFDLRIRTSSSTPEESDEADEPDSADPPASSLEPNQGTLAGLPRHILESERLDRGALLRDTLLHRPSSRDD
jgi:hypothetical protein